MNKKSKLDLSDITKKIDLNNIVNSIKSIVNPGGGTPEADPEDALGVKMAQISILVQELAKNQEQQAKDLLKVNQLINELFQDLQRLRGETKTTDENDVNVQKPKPKKKPRSSKSSKE